MPNGEGTIAASGKVSGKIAATFEAAANELRDVGTKTASGNTIGCCAAFQGGNELLLQYPK